MRVSSHGPVKFNDVNAATGKHCLSDDVREKIQDSVNICAKYSNCEASSQV